MAIKLVRGTSPAKMAVVVMLLSAAIPTSAQSPGIDDTTIVVAVVRDGPPADVDIVPSISEELARHLPAGTTARFAVDPAFDAGWDVTRVRGALENALVDPEVDLVLGTGSVGTAEASRMELAKPVVSTSLLRADVFGLPIADDDRSLHDNLALVVLSHRAERDIEVFQSLVPFGTLHIFVGAEEVEGLGISEEKLRAKGEARGIRIEIVKVEPDVERLLGSLGSEVEAVYLTRMPRLDTGSRSRLISGLTDRRIPTFSMVGHADAALGALAGLTPETGQQLVRRASLNLNRLIRGEGTADLPLLLRTDSRLLIDGRTAAALRVPLSPDTLLFASFLHREALEQVEEPLDLPEVFRMAQEQNTSLAVQDSVTRSAQQDAEIAKSFLLPQLGLDLSALGTDAEIAFTNAGVAADGSARGSLDLQQMIYDDRSVSDLKSARRLAESSEADYQTVRLAVLARAGRSYVNLGRAEALLEVELQNLRLSEDNLELARLREEVGYSGRDEVLRWQAVVADNRSAVFSSVQDVETNRIALNQILNVDQGRRWRIDEAEVDPESFEFLGGQLADAFGSPHTWRRIRAAFAEVARENSPEIRARREVVEAQQIQVSRSKRAYYLPSFWAGASYSDEIVQGDSTLPLFGDDFYTVTINLSYPVFQGGRKASESEKARVDLEGAEQRLDLSGQMVERRTRSALSRVENSFPRIRLSEDSARATGENLVIVQDKYAEGLVNVTDLLSAQTGKFASDRLVVVSVYDFLLDLIELQRALSWFEAEKSAGEREALAERVLAAAEVE
jgi:outer membrane protein TolC